MKLNELALFGGDPVRKTPFFPWPRVVDGQKEQLIDTLINDSWGIGSESIKLLDLYNLRNWMLQIPECI